jgi:hypothetical protein
MTKHLRGVVFAAAEDDEHEGMAHLWIRDAETGYWFSLSRDVDSDLIEVMVSDQLAYVGDVPCVTLTSSCIRTRLSASAASMLDGHLEYIIELHPESQNIDVIGATLEIIFCGKPGALQLSI